MKTTLFYGACAAGTLVLLGGLLLAAEKPRLIDVAKKQAGCSEDSCPERSATRPTDLKMVPKLDPRNLELRCRMLESRMASLELQLRQVHQAKPMDVTAKQLRSEWERFEFKTVRLTDAKFKTIRTTPTQAEDTYTSVTLTGSDGYDFHVLFLRQQYPNLTTLMTCTFTITGRVIQTSLGTPTWEYGTVSILVDDVVRTSQNAMEQYKFGE